MIDREAGILIILINVFAVVYSLVLNLLLLPIRLKNFEFSSLLMFDLLFSCTMHCFSFLIQWKDIIPQNKTACRIQGIIMILFSIRKHANFVLTGFSFYMTGNSQKTTRVLYGVMNFIWVFIFLYVCIEISSTFDINYFTCWFSQSTNKVYIYIFNVYKLLSNILNGIFLLLCWINLRKKRQNKGANFLWLQMIQVIDLISSLLWVVHLFTRFDSVFKDLLYILSCSFAGCQSILCSFLFLWGIKKTLKKNDQELQEEVSY